MRIQIILIFQKMFLNIIFRVICSPDSYRAKRLMNNSSNIRPLSDSEMEVENISYLVFFFVGLWHKLCWSYDYSV